MKKLFVVEHPEENWRLTLDADNNWIGVIEDEEGEEIADLTGLAVLDFKLAHKVAMEFVEQYNKKPKPRFELPHTPP